MFPTPQVPRNTSPGNAQPGSANQSGDGSPKICRICASQPVLPFKYPCHTIVLATSGTITGMKKSVLKTGLPRSSFWFSRRARPRARQIMSGTDIAAKVAVTPSDLPASPFETNSLNIWP